jgi:hypothetical protein
MTRKKRTTRPKTEAYSVTKSGPHHKHRKHAVVDEDTRLKRMATLVQKERERIADQRRRRAAGKSTEQEKQNRRVLLGPDGKFKKGNPGVVPGRKAHIPGERAVKASVRTLIEEVVRDNSKTIRSALLRGLRSGPRHADRYLKLSAEYMDGKPVDTINVNSQYKQDELESAKRTLGKKLDRIFNTILKNRETPLPDGPSQS